MRRRSLIVLAVLLPLLAAPPGAAPKEEEEGPTPAERVAKLKKDWAKKRADLGSWAAGKKLGKVAGAQFRLAIRMDPDCQRARSRLGYKKDKSGAWVRRSEKKWEYGKGAVEKYGDQLRQKEATLLAKEVAAFEELGVALEKEGEGDLGRRLLLRVHLLAPSSQRAAESLGLVKIKHGWGTEAEAKNVLVTPSVGDAGPVGFLSRVLGMRTTVRRCGAVLCETAGDKRAAEEMARLGQQVQVLTCSRFGLPVHRGNWYTLVVAGTQQQFAQFVDRCGAFQEPWLSACKKLGTARAYGPRLFAATFGDAYLGGLFSHCVGEDALCWVVGQKTPAWLHEAVAMDASLTLIGNPGTVCVTYEESLGLREKDPLRDPEDFGRRLLRSAGLGDLPRFELMMFTQLAAIGREDLIAAHAYYRFLHLTERQGLSDFAVRLKNGEKQEEAVQAAFGRKPEEIGAAFLGLVSGE
ncbi:MAG: hypothetical protein ACYS99_01195 [Planctomycetota bacterium]|jgi:hypothetical protein